MTDHADTLWHYIRILSPDLLDGAVREHRFHARRRWRFDIAWPALRVAVEVDGGRWKAGGGRHGSDGDYHKRNAAALAGWLTLAFTTRMVNDDPQACVDAIRTALHPH